MKLWVLEAIEWQGYDEYLGFVIRAKSSFEAREIASRESHENDTENETTWLDSKQSTCEELLTDGEVGIILGSFNAG